MAPDPNPAATPQPALASARARWRLHAALIALTLAAYANAPLGRYCYDDVTVISERRAIESWAGLPKLVSREYCPAFGELSYRPLVSLSYFLDGAVFGKSPFYSRWINIVLHLAVGLALFGLWNELFGRPWLSFLAAAFFLVHPITTEAVDCAGFREELLSTLLMVWSLRLLWRGLLAPSSSGRWLRSLSAAAVWLLALLAKESALSAVALAPTVFLVSPAVGGALRPWDRSKAKRLAPAVLGFAAAFSIWLWLYLAFSHGGAKPSWPGGRGPLLGVLNFCRTFVLYLRLWALPVGLSVGHCFEVSGSYGDWRLWAGAAVAALFAAGSALAFVRGRIAGAGGLWVCFALAPVAQLIPTPELLAERFLYMPHAGMALLFAALLCSVRSAWERKGHPGRLRVWKGAIAALIAVLIALTSARNRDWRDDATLNIRRYEQWNNAVGRAALGALHLSRNELDKARSYCLEALAMDADLADAHRVLGLIYLQEGRADLARPHIERAVELDPGKAENRGALERLNQSAPAGPEDIVDCRLPIAD